MVAAGRLEEIDGRAGCEVLVAVLAEGEMPVFRSEALDLSTAQSAEDFGFEPLNDPDTPANRAALTRWRQWLAGFAKG